MMRVMQATAFHASRHLTEAELYPAEERCPVCLWVGRRQAVFRIQESPEIDMLECPRCRACSASHMPRQQVLEEYYAGYYTGRARKNTCPEADRLSRHILRHVDLRTDGAPLGILDFGGGDGALSREIAEGLLRQQAPPRIAIDLIDYHQVEAYCTDRVSLRTCPSLDESAGAYDLVIASAILEHIPEVNGVMRSLFGKIRAGGYFYARTPFILPIAQRLKWVDITYPGHVHDMGCSFWNRITDSFDVPARVVLTGPSPVETRFCENPVRATVAAVLKMPSHLESVLSRPDRKDRVWTLVGGWEIILQVPARL